MVLAVVACTLAVPALTGVADASGGQQGADSPGALPGGYKHLVVIYEENHSFDNLYGGWGSVDGQKVDGLENASTRTRTQVGQDGVPFDCLLQDDVNLTSPTPLPSTCSDVGHGITSHFGNGPFSIDDFIAPTDTTCPDPAAPPPAPANGVLNGAGLSGGCTRDLVHRFYQEQYQLNGGRQNRYVTGSDAVGLTMGNYDTQALPIYSYLHSASAPHYVIADRFFQAAFGGSFLNHQWLIAARSPLDTNPAFGPGGLKVANSVLDTSGMVNSYPLYKPTTAVVDGALTQKCANPAVDDAQGACGNFAVNTIQPASPPHNTAAELPLIDDTVFPNIGDRMSAAGISWNWYTGRWDAVQADPKSAPLFQFHHQPFNYFADYAPGQPGRTHLQDETRFFDAASAGELPTVSFVKPYGEENEHPGYASEPDGSTHLVDLIKAVVNGPQAKDTLVVVTYDEFGGQWDHVAPPGSGGSHNKSGTHDAWGPGTRIPALVLSASLPESGVDHTTYDTTSILATIEHSFGLQPLSSRDARVNDLTAAVRAGGRH